ncbi:MAG TPA: UDP-N-acetylglucosamine 2-epimerase (non-hydrolyzing) [Acidimicrobiales bacterium]|jgi:UDP-GlcNAc3NAcA epimerase|nr:UDP-N-acetylglucosamine 2-epimerase (non-hydrolyzing) [Acidimicrobiales bacterium]
MNETLKIVTVVGARPQLVKAAALAAAAREEARVEDVVIHTGQHFDASMSDVFFAELDITPPRHHLGISGGGHGEMTGRMMTALEPVIEAERPNIVVVYGDTNSTVAAALVAAKLHVPVCHVEAGLRSFNRRMPEEINRVVTDHVSSLLFCPTTVAVDNLAREGVTRGVHHVGDVMYDVALRAAERARGTRTIVGDLGLRDGEYAVATVHRAENTESEEALRQVVDYLRREASTRPVVLPLHPRTKAAAERWGLSFGPVTVIPPVGFLDMTRLLMGAALALTDSGGVQKEAYFHGVPCVTMRGETEWVETIQCGWNRLWTDEAYAPRRPITDYGDGHAAARILEILQRANEEQ